jgi:hypothetical protein
VILRGEVTTYGKPVETLEMRYRTLLCPELPSGLGTVFYGIKKIFTEGAPGRSLHAKTETVQ